jgi:DNA-binding transcriptional MerR regulator
MAKLARAGFSLDIIKSILALNSIEEAEELEAQYQCEQSF